MINISNSTSKNNPPWLPAEPVRPARPAQPRAPGADITTPARDTTAPASPARVLAVAGRVLLSWLAAIPRRLGDRLFARNDAEAYWRDWEITKTHGGLARGYRDPQFGTLAECPKCHGASVTANLPCVPCLGLGRVTFGEVG